MNDYVSLYLSACSAADSDSSAVFACGQTAQWGWDHQTVPGNSQQPEDRLKLVVQTETTANALIWFSVWVGHAGSGRWAHPICRPAWILQRFQSVQPAGGAGAAGGAAPDSHQLWTAAPPARCQRIQWVTRRQQRAVLMRLKEEKTWISVILV